jgi:hypothetical protein
MPEDVKPVKPAKVEEPAAAADQPADRAAAAGGAKKKDNKTLKIVLIVVGVLVGLGLLATIAMIAFGVALFNNAADKVDVDDGQVTFQSDDGTVKTNVGEGTQLAEGFPSDVPIYEPSTLMSSSKVNNDQFSAVAKTSKSVADVSAYYKAQMMAQGWTNELDSSASDSTLLTYSKDNRTASVVVTSTPDEQSSEKTGFVVTVSTNAQ